MAVKGGTEIAKAYVTLHTVMPGVKKDIEKAVGAVNTSKIGARMGSDLGASLVAKLKLDPISQKFNKLGKTFSDVGSGLTSKITKPAGIAAAAVGGLTAALGFKRLVGIDTARGQFKGLGLDADAVMAQVDKGVTNTALSMADGASMAVGILATGAVPLGGLEDQIKRVANVSAAYNVDSEQAAYLLNNVLTKNKVTWGDLSQMQMNQIPIVSQLADYYGVTGDEIMKMAQDGKISIEDLNKVLDDNAGAAAEEYAKTWKGVSENILANIGKIGAKFLEPSFEILKDKAADLLVVLQSPEFASWATDMGQRISDFVADAVQAISRLVDWWNGLSPATQKFIGKLGLIAVAAGPALKVLGFLSTGIGKVVSGVAKTIGVVSRMAGAMKSASDTIRLVGMFTWDYVKAGAAKAKSLAVSAALWVKNTAVTVAQKTALVASTVATKAAAVAQRVFNAVMRANPLGLVITAVTVLVGALVWFFTKTEVGQKLAATFFASLKQGFEQIKAVVTAVLDFVVNTWSNSWNAIKTFFTDLWDGITGWFQEKLDYWKLVFKIALDILKSTWSNIWNAIKSFFTGLWDGITGWFQKKLDYWKLVFKLALGILKNTWSTVWNSIKSFFTGIWDGITGWFTSKLDYWKLVFRLALDILKSTWSNVWNSIKSTFSNVWNAIKGTFNTMIGFVKTKPVQAFAAARDGIGKAWDGIKALAKKPVRFVIDTVFNGMIGALNKIPGVNLKKIALPKGFRVGGYTGNVGVNAPAGVVHGREFVTRAESTAKIMRNHPGVLEHMNRYGEIPGYRKGGLVHPLPGATDTGGWMSYPGHRGQDWAKPQGSLIRAALGGRIVYAGWGEGWGNNILIDHGGGFSTRYAHIMHGGFLRRSGAVAAGQNIAKVGSTGRSTGPHLHFETLENGVRVNPAPYLSGAKTGGGFDVIAGLKDWALKKFNSFGENNLFVDAAKGVMTSGVTKLIDWGKSKLGFGGDGLVPTLFDNGGWLDPGTHFVANRTRSPEPILTGNQWDALTSRDSFPRQMRLVVGDREFDAYVEEIADANTRAHLSPMSPRRVRAELGVS